MRHKPNELYNLSSTKKPTRVNKKPVEVSYGLPNRIWIESVTKPGTWFSRDRTSEKGKAAIADRELMG